MKKVSKPKLSAQIRIERAKEICELYSYGEYTIASCCKALSVNYSTFQYWAQVNLSEDDIKKGRYRRGFVHDVHELYKRAINENNKNRRELIRDAALDGLLLKARGVEYEEVIDQITYDKKGKVTGSKKTTTNKIILPSDSALIFLAKNLDKATFGDEVMQSPKLEVLDKYAGMTLEEVKAERIRLEAELASDSEI